MKSPQTILVLLLSLTTLGGAALAWRQYRELVELRASAMNNGERAELQNRIWDLEKMNRDLQDRLAAARGADGTDEDELAGLLAEGDQERPEGGRGRGGRGGRRLQQMNAIRELMAKPEVQAMLTAQQKAALDTRYAALFKNLNLPPEQIEQLKNMLLERQASMQDVFAAALDQGIDPRSDPEGFRKLLADVQNDVNSNIKSVIGDAGFAQLQNYEQTLSQRNLVNDLQQRLYSADMPLTSAQADQLVQILAANQPQRGTSGTAGAGGFGVRGDQAVTLGGRGGSSGLLFGAVGGGTRGGGAATVTDAALAQAQTVLGPSQLTALQQIQQQQQTQQQLQQLVRETAANAAKSNTDAEGSTQQQGRKRDGG